MNGRANRGFRPVILQGCTNRAMRKIRHLLPELIRRKPVLLSMLVFGACALAAGYALLQQKPAAAPQNSRPAVITYSTDTPEETKPGADYQWQGQAHEPKRISVPTLGIDGYIQKVGVDQHKQVAVPSNVHMAGWFTESAKPGSAGLSIIDGHVDGRESDGIFKQLAKSKKDDVFEVELGDGTLHRFTVITVVTVDTKDAASVLFSQNPGVKSQLNLITCGGTFDTKTKSYDKRVIVSAQLVSR